MIKEFREIKVPTDAELKANEERRLASEDTNCLSYWFPKLAAAGLPVPKTRIVKFTDYDTYRDLFLPFDGKPFGPAADAFLAKLRSAVAEIGVPCFMRTGQTSGKHSWKDTCYLECQESLEAHVLALIEFSECADIFGLMWNVWAFRELLPTLPIAKLPRYGDMPLCREFRCFVDGETVLCVHGYWPWNAVEQGFPPKPMSIEGMSAEEIWGDSRAEYEVPAGLQSLYNSMIDLSWTEDRQVRDLASSAGKAVGGRWSVDILDTDRGWFITDMARMEDSFHWPGCPNAPKAREVDSVKPS